MRFLKLNKAGMPLGWTSPEDAATLYAKGMVLWELGDQGTVLRGGTNNLGIRSEIAMSPIIACQGRIKEQSVTPMLSNRLLFRRDHYRCMYCGGKFDEGSLTRDHVIPRALM